MIVPFGMIPAQFLAPLNVETKMEYTINKRKFPGLKDKSRACHPALLIATKAEEASASARHPQNSPIDLSQTARTNAAMCCSNIPDIRQRHSLRRPPIRSSAASRMRLRQMGERKNPTTSAEPGRPEMNGHHPDVRTPDQTPPDVCPAGAGSSRISRDRTPIATHPSYLDFIYGENGILASKVTTNLPNQPHGNADTRSGSKRKRGAVEVEVAEDTEEFNVKKHKSTVGDDTVGSNGHTIHYLPTAASVICGKPTKDNTAILYTNAKQLWPAVASLGSYNDQVITTSRRVCGRQS